MRSDNFDNTVTFHLSILTHFIKMTTVYILAVLLCCSQLVLATNDHPADEDGDWVDDVSNNPEIMGMMIADEDNRQDDDGPSRTVAVVSPMRVNEDDGEWVDDVTGNLLILGEDPLSQSTGLTDDMNSGRKKRSASKKLWKAMKKASKKGKRELTDTWNGDREKRSPHKNKMHKSLLKAMKRG